MPKGNLVVDRAGRIVVHGLPTFGAALAVAATLDVFGQHGPYSAVPAAEVRHAA